MLITDLAWKIEGVPKALIAPLVPWHSVLLDVSEPCFVVMPRTGTQHRQTHARLFSDVDQLVRYTQVEPGVVYAFSRSGDEMTFSKVHAIGSYPCPQTGIKFKVFFDDSEQPWPAHSGQSQFSRQLTFDVEASFV
ncbi:hypothetical protein [Herbaspirillum chlorophenolicum]|uniref:hypothetical protein n=1 Tax=Herbaspirillum chlorophenolicum TaxID=211589 RepID=UPI0012E18119|nr:hypothetical protein [Herbaspirillum chlorophenolicum]